MEYFSFSFDSTQTYLKHCVQLAGADEQAKSLLDLTAAVRSGDADNVEATAAQQYFPALFGAGFTRGEESGRNAALNYGYAILRGCVARTLAVYGFIPTLGLHHRSTLNPFNLADDLMEPFRPLIDLLVFREIQEQEDLSPSDKRMLFNCLNLDLLVDGRRYTTDYAIERTVQSLGKAAADKEEALLLPKLTELRQHRYE